MDKIKPKYTNMTHWLISPEKYPGVKIQTVMRLDTLYVTELIDKGIFKPSPRAMQELQRWIDHHLLNELQVTDPLDYMDNNN